MKDLILQLLSTDLVVYAALTIIVSAFATHLVKWLATERGEDFRQYEGWVIAGIKFAEKYIIDKTANSGAKKLGYVLKLFLDKYETATGKKVDLATYAKIEAWISEIHASLEEAGALPEIAPQP